MNGGEPATLVWQFENFTKAGTCKSILSTFHELCDAAGLKHDTHTNFYRRLKSKINFWKAQNVWVKLDKHASRKEYRRGEACSNTRVCIHLCIFMLIKWLLQNRSSYDVFLIGADIFRVALMVLVEFLDPSDSYFLFANLVGFYTHWTYMHVFRHIFLSNYWWQKSDIWSQASYRYPIWWEAFLDPSDSYFLFADFVDFYSHWTYMLIFRRIFLSNYWWQRSDIWSQASYRYPISWEAFLDPSDSYFLFAEERGYHKWALAHSSSCFIPSDIFLFYCH